MLRNKRNEKWQGRVWFVFGWEKALSNPISTVHGAIISGLAILERGGH
jgi:hypothetical protein